MTAHIASVVLVTFALAQTAGAQTGTRPAQTSTAKPGTLVLTVVNESGGVVAGADVDAHGAVDRSGMANASGVVTLVNLPAGTYRCRITADGFVMLDKEVTIRAGARLTAEAVLSPAPKPAPTTTPPPTQPVQPIRPADPRPAAPGAVGPVGAPRVVSIPDLVDRELLRLQQPLVERDLGCSVSMTSRVIVARENILIHRHADADEVLYLVAGDATLTLADKEQNISAGVYVLVPRGVSHSITRRGRNPPVLLSVQSGPPCTGL